MKKKMKLRLTIDVTYEGNEFELAEALECLWDVIPFAADRGTLTGDFGATIKEYDYNVEEVKE